MKREITSPPTNRSLAKLLFLGILTLGIYPIVIYTRMARELNRIVGDRDGRKTMHFCLMTFVFAPLTLGIADAVWWHRFSNRIGVELARRGLPYRFSAGTFWGRNLFSILISLTAILALVYVLLMRIPLPPLNLYWAVGALVFVVLVAIGPCIFAHKLCTAMNMLSGDYNSRG